MTTSPTSSLATTATPALATTPPTQLGGFNAYEWGLLGVELATVLLGLAIAYVAVQGYRRNESRPMLFVASGFVLLVGVPTVTSTVFLLTDLVPQSVLAAFGSVGEALGMASILYGLRAPTGR